MKNCPKCGTPLEDDAKVCNICGAKLIKEDKTALILAIISVVLVCFGFSIIVNALSIIVAIVAIVLGCIKKVPSYFKWTLGLSIFGILGSIVLIIFNFI